MKITELSIKKPIAITMIVIACILFGIMGYINLGADLFPKVNIPVVVINTIYPGAGTEEIEKDIAKPIEDAVSVVSGVDKANSTISEGVCTTVVMFKMSADSNAAVMDTQKALDGVLNQLPKDAERPSLKKFDQNAQPILIVTLSGNKPYEELYDDAKTLKERLERVEGVGDVSIFGGMKKELVIKLDKSKLDFYGLSIPQIMQYLQAENITMPGGTINPPEQDQTVRVDGKFKDINEVKSCLIPANGGSVQLGDIAQVSLEYPKTTEISRANGTMAIGLTIQKQSDANIVETGKKVKDEIAKLKTSFKGTDLNIVQDSTIFITSSLSETKRNLIEGIITTALVLLLFLRQWRSALIVLISIPTSLISTFFMMYIMGFTFNILSLMGLALCIGILVDDSIVVIENIHRHLDMGKDPKTAALDGRSEIGMAAIAITLSDIVVFMPIAFMSGMVGQYFKQFGLTVVFATIFSLFVSFTLTPMMASRLFKQHDNEEKEEKGFEKLAVGVGESVKNIYKKALGWALNHRIKIMAVIFALLIGAISLIPLGAIGTEFMPYTDEGECTVNFELTPGSTLEQTNQKAKLIENYIKTIPEVNYYYTSVGINNLVSEGSIYVKLVDKKHRSRSQKQIVEDIRSWSKNGITGVNFTVNEPSIAGAESNGGKPIYINIKGSKNDVIKDIANKVKDIVKSTQGTVDVADSFEGGQPELSIKVDRLEASKYGVSVNDISNTVRASIEGLKAGVFSSGEEDYDIRVKLFDSQVTDINGITSLNVINNQGQSISLGQVASITMTQSPTILKRVDKQRLANVTSNLKIGYTLGEVVAQIQKKIDQLSLPDGYSVSFTGEQQNMNDAFTSLIQVLIASVALVYMILVVLYESFLTPFVRILALPVGAVGALTMLALTGKSLNMLSMIGLIMLDGLAAKNGTLLIDYTNTLMSRGISLREALFEAGTTRLKPIFMTSVTMIMGMLPTALSLGDGSEYKSGMAVVIIGGMITSTILSPILLPVAYTLIDDFKHWVKSRFAKKKVKNISQTA